ncbi:MAG: DUF3606 domain-containing protein [Rubrivivax sp.]
MDTLDPGFRPLDPGRINTIDPVEMGYWCREFGCTDTQLQAAVAAVGEHVAEVRDWLARPAG